MTALPLQLSPSSLDLVTVIPHHHIVLCQHCQIGVLLDEQWDRHFGVLHKLPLAARSAMKSRVVTQDPDIIKTSQQLVEEFQYPSGKVPLPHLPIYSDGIACLEYLLEGALCQYVCRSKPGIKQHYQNKHGWQNLQARGGSQAQRSDIQRPWQTEVQCQRLFHNGPRNGYWRVTNS